MQHPFNRFYLANLRPAVAATHHDTKHFWAVRLYHPTVKLFDPVKAVPASVKTFASEYKAIRYIRLWALITMPEFAKQYRARYGYDAQPLGVNSERK